MRFNLVKTTLFGVLLLALAGACSDDGGDLERETGPKPDTRPVDASNLPDGYKLWSCKTPGTACEAHDPCAVNPICGTDKVCRPEYLQNCDDNLSCTYNRCKGLGMCDNSPMPGFCALPVKIYPNTKLDGGLTPADGGAKDGAADAAGDAAGSGGAAADAGVSDATAADAGPLKTVIHCFRANQRNPNDPCKICIPEGTDSGVTGNSRRWSGANGGTCDDNNACTMNDYCQQGVCKGISFASKCADNLGCTQDLCDGKGGCLGNKLKSGWCLINNTCYLKYAKQPGGACYHCDPDSSTATWTAITNACTIGGLCYKAGDKDPTGCFVCDPKTSTSSWTKVSGLCSIGGKCYTKGTLNSGKCAECDPSASTTSWTVKGNACLISDICRKPGDKDTSGCGQCDPTKDKYKWSAVSNTCLISGICYSNGALDVTKCKVCDPSKNSTGWSTRSGVCDVEGSCYSNGDKHPGGCAECDTSVSLTSWTVKGNFCYVDKGCRKPGDKDPSGCRECTPATSKYAWTPSSGRCYIGSTCYRSGDKDSTTCGSCVPATSQTSWTVTGNVCLINGTCYQPGALSSNKCGKCDPSSSKSSWSAISGKCLIHGACYADGATHSSGCLKCDYSTSSTLWSATGSSKLSTYTFESGKTTGWTISAKVGTVGWQVSNNRKATGSYSLYFGDAQNKTYGYGNSRVNGTAVTPQFTVAAGKKAGLTFDLWMDVEAAQGFDYLRIYVTGETKVLWEKNVTETVKMKSWQPVSVDLSAHAGKTISVTFEFDTKDGTGNTGEGVYIDDLFVYHDC